MFDDPPAPAARDELGFTSCVPAARRLDKFQEIYSVNLTLP